jgi:hypothetical protein
VEAFLCCVGGSAIKISGGGVEIVGGAIKIAGGAIDLTGSEDKAATASANARQIGSAA